MRIKLFLQFTLYALLHLRQCREHRGGWCCGLRLTKHRGMTTSLLRGLTQLRGR